MVVPVWNDPDGLRNLTASLLKLETVSEIIVVDDCSREPVESQVDFDPVKAAGKTVEIVRQPANLGAGAARNTGLARVTNSHVIFFDSDDLPLGELDNIFRDFLDVKDSFDFAMFRHLDSREVASGHQGGLKIDERLWRRLGDSGPVNYMSAEKRAEMAMVAAYPWNKLYRTEFLRSNNIRCTEIPVHNDIELHWSGFLQAESVAYTKRLGATHHVADTGTRLTNRTGAERLRVFEALRNVGEILVRQNGTDLMTISYWRFVAILLDWISDRMGDEWLPTFYAQKRKFLFENLSEEQIWIVANTDPALSGKIIQLLRKEA